MLDAAVDMLPGADAAGHRDSDDTGLVQRALVVRIDAGGCSATPPTTPPQPQIAEQSAQHTKKTPDRLLVNNQG